MDGKTAHKSPLTLGWVTIDIFYLNRPVSLCYLTHLISVSARVALILWRSQGGAVVGVPVGCGLQHQSKRRETGKVKSKFVLTKREVVKREGF